MKYRHSILVMLVVVMMWSVGVDGAAHFSASAVPEVARLTAPAAPFDSAELEKFAVTDGYGFKYGNLMLLQRLASSIAGERYSIAVPEFVGVPSARIKAFLGLYGVDVDARLEALLKTLTDDAKNAAFETKTLPEAVSKERQALEDAIAKAFSNYASAVEKGAGFSFDRVFGAAGVDARIATIAGRSEKLMVRSTGGEDRDNLANAGGNKSVANVVPNAVAVIRAMGEVVSSYMSEKSWMQRLGAGDASLFDANQLMPVLIQRMIGEKDSGGLPKCGVMFTEEAEGGISCSKEKDAAGKIKTTGITIIQCAYGHNEGVVNSLIPVDTYYVPSPDMIYPVIRNKTHRLKPRTEDVGLETVPNEDAALVRNASLSAQAIRTLKALSDGLESFYKKPMDVEFVVDEAEKRIYIVQARPIVHVGDSKPSYLVGLDKVPAEDKLVGQSIGVAGGGLRIVGSAEQLIAKGTIGDALATYQDRAQTPNPSAVRAIVVGKMAPATSHEATAFRSEEKPVLCIAAWDRVAAWAQRGALIVDPQQAAVVKLVGDVKTAAELVESKRALAGWVAYPVPKLVSLNALLAPKGLLHEEALILLAGSEDGYKKIKDDLTRQTKHTSWKELLSSIKQGPEAESRRALVQLLLEVRMLTVKYSKSMKLDSDLRTRREQLQGVLLACAKKIKPLLGQMPGSEGYIKRLFAAHFLEAALLQQPAAGEIVDGYSAVTLLLKELKVEQEVMRSMTGVAVAPAPSESKEEKKEQADDGDGVVDEREDKDQEADDDELTTAVAANGTRAKRKVVGGSTFGEKRRRTDAKREDAEEVFASEVISVIKEARRGLSIQYRKMANYALTDELRKQWISFNEALEHEKDAKTHRDFGMLIARDLAPLGMLPMWLNTSFAREAAEAFARAAAEAKDPRALVKRLVDEFTSQRTFVADVVAQQQKLKALNISLFAKPALHAKAWKAFYEDILTYFLSEGFKKAYPAANNLGKMAANSVLAMLVDLFDQSIKQLTGSTEFTPVAKIPLFRAMLEGYANLLDALVKATNFVLKVDHLSSRNLETYRAPHQFAGIMKDFLKAPVLKDASTLLRVSPGVDVSSLNVSNPSYYISIYEFLQNKPSYEDIFIMTHQSLLAILMSAGNASGVSDIPKPALVEAVIKMIMSIETGYTPRAELIGVEMQGRQLKMMYSIPLGVHSLLLDVVYSMASRTVALTVTFSGENDDDRWFNMLVNTELVGAACSTPVRDFVSRENGITFTVTITEASDIGFLGLGLGKLCQYTLHHEFDQQNFLDVLKKRGEVRSFYDNLVKKYDTKILAKDHYIFDLAIFSIRSGIVDESHIALATEGIRSVDMSMSIPKALELWGVLVEKGRGIEDAIELVSSKAISFEHKLNLWKALIAKGRGIEKAIRLASSNTISSGHAMKLWTALVKQAVEKENVIEQAITAAEAGMRSDDSSSRADALELWKALVERGHGIDQAIKLVTELQQSDDWGVSYPADRLMAVLMNMFKARVEKGEDPAQAIKVAEAGILSGGREVRYQTVDLWKALAEKGHGVDRAMSIVDAALGSDDKDQAEGGFALLGKLISGGFGIEGAKKIARDGMRSSASGGHKKAIAVLMLLCIHDKADEAVYAQALTAAQEGARSDNNDIRKNAFMLFGYLAKKDNLPISALSGAIEDLLEGVRSDNRDIVDCALDELDKLFEKGYGFEQAKKVLPEISDDATKKELQDMINRYKPAVEKAESKAPAAGAGVV